MYLAIISIYILSRQLCSVNVQDINANLKLTLKSWKSTLNPAIYLEILITYRDLKIWNLLKSVIYLQILITYRDLYKS